MGRENNNDKETNEEMRKSLSFSKGLTNVPSDMLSDDSMLQESTGIIFRSGEMHPLQQPYYVATLQANEEMIFVHKGADYSNVITYDGEETIRWYKLSKEGGKASIVTPDKDTAFKVGKVTDIQSVGNTLTIATDKNMSYLLYKGGAYKLLGNELPKPNVKFRTSAPVDEQLVTKRSQLCDIDQLVDHPTMHVIYNEDGTIKDIYNSSVDGQTSYETFNPKDARVDDLQTAISGHVAQMLSLVKEKNGFAFPFFVRFALRLFDGSYARISAPVAVFPTITRNNYIVPAKWKDHSVVDDTGSALKLLYSPSFVKLQYQASMDGMDKWSDIVKEIVVFATDDVLPFRVDDKWKIVHPLDSDGQRVVDYIGMNEADSTFRGKARTKIKFTKDDFPARDVVMPEKYKTEAEIIEEMLSKTQFFKLFTVKTGDIDETVWKDAPIKDNVVTNLLQQEQLGVDDYYGWATKKAGSMYTYNKRLNLFGVKRYPFEGFSSFVANPDTDKRDCRLQYFVHIVSDTMDTWVVSGTSETRKEVADTWIYYPDPNATEVIVFDTLSASGMRIPMQQHERLNGAYAFRRLPLEATMSNEDITLPTPDPEACEDLSSQIFTSVVNNPFVYEATGDNTVGTGKIVGIAANTEPISQGQFGQYPLVVFTSEGIYAMTVSDEGLYTSSRPLSREVCNNAASITPTGSMIFFTSARGLMAVSGNTVACMSEQLRGRKSTQFATLGDGDFLSFLEDSLIAYDYRDSLLHIFSHDRDYHYIYSIPDRTFGMSHNVSESVAAVVSSYPDMLVQEKGGEVYSLLSKPDINDDTNIYNASFTTRPLKLDASILLKTIHQIVHLYDSAEGTLTLRVYGSNDCRHWNELRSLHGKPWKYFVLQYTLGNMAAADTFAGTVMDYETRFGEKVR